MFWPMSQTIYALTGTNPQGIRHALTMLKTASAGTGFMHESYSIDDPHHFTRAWFAWANTPFGNLSASSPTTCQRCFRWGGPSSCYSASTALLRFRG
jgi:meiotically up-regulated gene 157 (Mug157) protein